ncbi:hypothetical protein BUALT_Bualt03G0213600 [Buddleja alternifolia]|uniref:Uncharacterized protein n=1 Tax=Buddleja alternifolia TaxID=168488 RepID=A0AAV6XVL2_9LAMI|nr:hypothetical protein BUALT_Bualt03G0213600 [Buddleja alternifolia]
MVDEGTIKLDMVPTTNILGQGLIHIKKEHVLRASVLKHIDENYVPFYNLTQQPIWMVTPLYPMGSRGNTLIPKVPFPTDNATQNKLKVDETPVQATPISYFAPEGLVPTFIMNNERQFLISQGGEGSRITRAPDLSYSKRKENWYIRRLARSKGNKLDLASRSTKLRGDKLLDRIPVGHYNLTSQQIFRHDHRIMPVSNRNKRKRENETSAQEGEGVSNAGIDAPQLIYTLYDFEPKLG